MPNRLKKVPSPVQIGLAYDRCSYTKTMFDHAYNADGKRTGRGKNIDRSWSVERATAFQWTWILLVYMCEVLSEVFVTIWLTFSFLPFLLCEPLKLNMGHTKILIWFDLFLGQDLRSQRQQYCTPRNEEKDIIKFYISSFCQAMKAGPTKEKTTNEKKRRRETASGIQYLVVYILLALQSKEENLLFWGTLFTAAASSGQHLILATGSTCVNVLSSLSFSSRIKQMRKNVGTRHGIKNWSGPIRADKTAAGFYTCWKRITNMDTSFRYIPSARIRSLSLFAFIFFLNIFSPVCRPFLFVSRKSLWAVIRTATRFRSSFNFLAVDRLSVEIPHQVDLHLLVPINKVDVFLISQTFGAWCVCVCL